MKPASTPIIADVTSPSEIHFDAGASIRSVLPADTHAVAAAVAKECEAGAVVALYGDLGAGKTEFTRGFVIAAGGDGGDVSSPTFTIIHEYNAPVPVYHFDAYRAKSAEELIDVGLDEYLFGDGICLIEWPEKIEHLLPEATIRLRFEHADGGDRLIHRLP